MVEEFEYLNDPRSYVVYLRTTGWPRGNSGFEDLNPPDMSSIEETEAEDSEVDSFITQAEVTEAGQKLLNGKAPGVDEIRPEYLKSLDVVLADTSLQHHILDSAS